MKINDEILEERLGYAMSEAINGSSEMVKCHLREARRYLYDNAKRFGISSDAELQQIELLVIRHLVEGLVNRATIELVMENYSSAQYFFKEADKQRLALDSYMTNTRN